MKINITDSDNTRPLWRESLPTLYQSLPHPKLAQAQRFHYGSIYFRDQLDKPKKVFTEIEKPELLLLNFRRQIEEETKRAQKKSMLPNTLVLDKRAKKTTLDGRQSEKFALTQRNGSESCYLGKTNIKDATSTLSRRKFFSSSKRIDLSKPNNAFPGPGAYFTE